MKWKVWAGAFLTAMGAFATGGIICMLMMKNEILKAELKPQVTTPAMQVQQPPPLATISKEGKVELSKGVGCEQVMDHFFKESKIPGIGKNMCEALKCGGGKK